MKQSHLAHFTDQKRCQIINNAISKCNPKLVRCFSDADVMDVTEKQFEVRMTLLKWFNKSKVFSFRYLSKRSKTTVSKLVIVEWK